MKKALLNVILFVCCICLAITACQKKQSNEKKTEVSEEQKKIEVTYLFTKEDISKDESTGINYINNILLVFFDIDISEEQKNKVVQAVDGEIAGRLDIIDQLQIRVSTSGLDELEALCEKVKTMDGVIDATYDTVAQYEETYIPNDPWGEKRLGILNIPMETIGGQK